VGVQQGVVIMPNTGQNLSDRGEIVIYQPAEGDPRLEVRLARDTLWLDAHQMASLFERDRTVILRHVRNVYATGELSPESTCAKNAQVAADGRLRQMDLYNLDMVISVGYRVNSRRGTQFRSISWSRITASWIATSASRLRSSSGSWRKTACCAARMTPGVSPTTPWSP
jgi:hypothetical protein